MTRNHLVALTALALLAGCGQQGGGDAAPSSGNPTRKLMAETVEPQAQILWKVAGSFSDKSGEHQLRPTTEEGWKKAEDAAARLVEMGKLLATSPYSDGRSDDWAVFARGLSELAEKNRKGVADRLSDDELLVLGGELYNVCQACHQAYPPAEPLPEA